MPDALEAVAITAGTGTNVAVDKVTQSAIDYQLQVVKIGLGADAALNLYLTNGQATMANSLPVALASNQSALTVAAGTTPNTYNVTLTTKNTEYSQALPSTCYNVAFQNRSAFDLRFAWVTGKVATPTAPYQTLKAGGVYNSGNRVMTSQTLYFACGNAGVVVEIEAWS